ncbi:MAG: Holliday junction resolvase RuvX [Candidatus Curtissbacteria bacterium]|nr:Holliday junction resolvase RuvX [Candidatus Curtissbacteria bacterium]
MILGIDLGEKTTGLAISESQLATPYATIVHKNQNEALAKITKVCNELGVDTVILGFVEGKIKSLFNSFAAKLQSIRPNLKIVLWDETLTSRQATENMIKLGIAKNKRATKQHEAAAAIILQSYLDSK